MILFAAYALGLFSFFHWLVGFGILGSIFASVVFFALTPFIWLAIATVSIFIWAAIIGLIGWVCGTFAYLFK